MLLESADTNTHHNDIIKNHCFRFANGNINIVELFHIFFITENVCYSEGQKKSLPISREAFAISLD